MVKIGSQIIEQHLLCRPSQKRAFIKDKDLQIQVSHSFDSSYHHVPTLKAVYPHFAQAAQKRKGVASETFNRTELSVAMDEAKNAFESMKEIQYKLNQAYKELVHPKK